MAWGQKPGILILGMVVILGGAACQFLAGAGAGVESAAATAESAVQASPSSAATSTASSTPTASLTPVLTVASLTSAGFPPTDTPIPRPSTSTLTPTPSLSPTEQAASPEAPDTAEPVSTVQSQNTAVPDAILQIVAQSCPRREACILSPQIDEVVSGVVPIRGGATRPDFDYYKLEYQREGDSEWRLIGLFEQPVRLGLLSGWRTVELPSGVYLLRLTVVDKAGNYWPEMPKVRVIVSNDEEAKNKSPLDALEYNPTPTKEKKEN